MTWVAIAGLGAALSGCIRSSHSIRNDEASQKPTSEPSYYRGQSEGGASGPGAERVAAAVQPKKKVAVFTFWNDTPVKQDELGEYAASELRRGLFMSKRILLADSSKTKFQTEDYIQGAQVKVAQLIREGRKQGLTTLIIGRITQVAFRQNGDEVGLLRKKNSLVGVTLEAKVFDVHGGRELLTLTKSGENSTNTLLAFQGRDIESPEFRSELTHFAVQDAVAGLIPEVIRVIDKTAWQGRIAKVLGSKIYLNAGRAAGLISGDILKVVSRGEEVYDPGSGAYLGISQGLVKGTLAIMDFIGPDGAVSEVHTGGGFVEGDLVQLY